MKFLWWFRYIFFMLHLTTFHLNNLFLWMCIFWWKNWNYDRSKYVLSRLGSWSSSENWIHLPQLLVELHNQLHLRFHVLKFNYESFHPMIIEAGMVKELKNGLIQKHQHSYHILSWILKLPQQQMHNFYSPHFSCSKIDIDSYP